VSAPHTTPHTTSSSTSSSVGSTPLRPAKQRTGAGPIGWVGPLLALLLTLLGLVLLRDGIFAPAGATGWPGDQQSWLTTATTAVDGLARATWMVPVGVIVALVGLYLLAVALRRRTRTTLALSGASGAYLLPVDVARRAASAADEVDGVLHASASATRRTVTVKVSTTGGKNAGSVVREEVNTAVAESVAALASPPRVRITTTTTGSTDTNTKDLS